MIDRKLLLSDLQKQLRNLEKDLREQAEPVDEVPLRLRGEYGHAFEVGRTAGTWAAWRGERVTQVAAPGCSTPGWRPARIGRLR